MCVVGDKVVLPQDNETQYSSGVQINIIDSKCYVNEITSEKQWVNFLVSVANYTAHILYKIHFLIIFVKNIALWCM